MLCLVPDSNEGFLILLSFAVGLLKVKALLV